MLGFVASGVAILMVISYLIVFPIIRYFYDPKGFRKYPNYALLSGVTDLRHCYLSSQGFRSKKLYETHVSSTRDKGLFD